MEKLSKNMEEDETPKKRKKICSQFQRYEMYCMSKRLSWRKKYICICVQNQQNFPNLSSLFGKFKE